MKKCIGGAAFRRGNKTSWASKLTRRQLGPKQKGVKVGRAKRFIVGQKSLVRVFTSPCFSYSWRSPRGLEEPLGNLCCPHGHS